MRDAAALAMPWAPPGTGVTACRPVCCVKLALGEAPEAIPASADVARGRAGGELDRRRRHRPDRRQMAGGVRVARRSCRGRAASASRARGTCDYDDRRAGIGMARTFRLRVPRGTPVGPLCETLAQIATVESGDAQLRLHHARSTRASAADRTPMTTAGRRGAVVRAARGARARAGRRGVIVGLVDSGIAPDHAELARASAPASTRFGSAIGTSPPASSCSATTPATTAIPPTASSATAWAAPASSARSGRRCRPGWRAPAQILPMRALGAARLPGKTAGGRARRDQRSRHGGEAGRRPRRQGHQHELRHRRCGARARQPEAACRRRRLRPATRLHPGRGQRQQRRARPATGPPPIPGVIAVGAVGADAPARAPSRPAATTSRCARPARTVLTTCDSRAISSRPAPASPRPSSPAPRPCWWRAATAASTPIDADIRRRT